MKDDIDIEEVLRRYRSDPSSQVKQSVLSRFTRTFGSRGPAGSTVGLWRKPIPLYLVCAKIIVAVGLSFFAGHRLFPAEQPLESSPESLQESVTIATQEARWEIAPNDLF